MSPQSSPEQLLTIDQLAEYLGVTRASAYNYMTRTKGVSVPRIKIGRQWRFRKSSIDAWIASLEKV